MTIIGLEETRAAWDAIAAGYDDVVTPTHLWLGREALRRAGLAHGMRFLDVAAGSGALALQAAHAGAEVVATDISPEMIRRLRTRASAEGIDDLQAEVMDGHALELEDDTFDLVGSQFGVMLFPDLPRALAEMVRVARPGGRVLLVVFGRPQEVEFLGFFVTALQTAVPGFQGLPMDPPPLPFQVADPEALRRALMAAGLESPRVETVTETMEFESGEQLWQWLLHSNPIAGGLVAGTTEAQRAAARETLEAMVRERANGRRTAVLTSLVHIGMGDKPRW